MLLWMTTLWLACAPPTGSANPDEGAYPSLPALDRQILAEMERGRIPGASACLIQGGEVAWCQGYGYADIEAERLVTPQTPFLLASVSKAFTATALAHAAQEGHLDLDADVNDALPFPVRHPDFPDTAITARMAAAHAAGN